MFSEDRINELLYALGKQIERQHVSKIELVVSGGAALNCMGLVLRTTKDIDCVAFFEKDDIGKIELKAIEAFPDALVKAAKKVGEDYTLESGWINFGPTHQVVTGLPSGIEGRLKHKDYGSKLRIHFISRFDQIHFKLYAAVDQGGRHLSDLIALNPNEEEIKQAALWCLEQDPSPAFGELMISLLKELGYEDVTNQI